MAWYVLYGLPAEREECIPGLHKLRLISAKVVLRSSALQCPLARMVSLLLKLHSPCCPAGVLPRIIAYF
jgi:hypothetical protein